MAETTKLRLVRCPKCENLLPELPDLPIYKCGGCGAVLQAKKRSSTVISDGSSEKSDEGNVRVSSGKSVPDQEKGVVVRVSCVNKLESDEESFKMTSGKLESSPDKGVEAVQFSDASQVSDRENDGIELKPRSQKRDLQDRTASMYNGSSSKVENTANSSSYIPRNVGQGAGLGGKYSRSSRDPFDSQIIIESDHGIGTGKDKSVGINIVKETGESNPRIATSRYRRSRELPVCQPGGRDQRTPRAIVDDNVRLPAFPYSGEGSSNYRLISCYGNGQLDYNVQNKQDQTDRVEYLERDRAELLRKLDELKDQLTRSCDVSEKVKENVSLNRRTVLPVPYVATNGFPDGTSRSEEVISHPRLADKHVGKPSYVDYEHEPIPLMPRHERDMQNFYVPPGHASNDRQGHGDPFGPDMLSRARNQAHNQHQHALPHGFFSGQYMDVVPEQGSPYSHSTFFHQPACCCAHCYNKGWQAPSQAPHLMFPNRRFSEASTTNPMFYHHEDPRAFGPWGYNPRNANHPLHARERQMRVRQNVMDSEIGSFGFSRPQRVMLPKKKARHCRPIAGGAPFITCSNCFQLLPLSKKLLLPENNQKKLQCGACSTVLSVAVESKRVVVSVPIQSQKVRLEVNDGSAEVVEDGYLHSHGDDPEQGRMKTYSDDYDNSDCNFLSMDAEQSFSPEDQRQTLSESEKTHGFSSSVSTYEDDRSPVSVNAQTELSSSPELPMRENVTPRILASPPHEDFELSSSDRLVCKFGKGNSSKRTDHEMILTRATSRQNSVKDAVMETEIDLPCNEYPNPSASQDPGQATREINKSRNSRGGSFIAGLIKKSFKDVSRSNQIEESDELNVSINGKSIPEKLIKKAEKKAGPIYPGRYWYDPRAGFWGVMGQPCLGIIPPFIEEFNYPLPQNCSNGDTGIFVNGRELHHNDLDLLSSRGLPTASDKSYILEISGRILDEDSGEELDSLGKLAPTVERLKRGFGMRDPRTSG